MSLRQMSGWVAFLVFLTGASWAQEPVDDLSAYEVVDNATQQIMATVEGAREYAEEDPERYYGEIQTVLDSVVDFRGFARGVMGRYASSDRYRSLDKAGQAELRAQLDRFTEVIRVGLVRTYGKGLLAFGGSRVEVIKPENVDPQASRVAVTQLVYNEEPEPYELLYQMGRSKSGNWKLRNIVILDVSLGDIYRSQFESLARKYDGDLDAVIDNWTIAEIETESEA